MVIKKVFKLGDVICEQANDHCREELPHITPLTGDVANSLRIDRESGLSLSERWRELLSILSVLLFAVVLFWTLRSC